MPLVKGVLIAAIAGYACCLAALYLLQRTILFPIPSRDRIAPDSAGFAEVEEHVLATADGEKIVAWHMPAKPGRPVVLYFHGNGDSLAGFFPRFRDIVADGSGIVAAAYRGYSGSTGRPSEQGLLRDAEAAYAFASARYDPGRIVVWGFSLGSGVAVALASRHSVGRVILEAPYSSVADVAASAFPFFPVRLLLKDPFRSDLRIEGVKVPLLFMHGARDATIPMASGERLFALAGEPKHFIRFPDGGHNDLDYFGASAAARRFINADGG